MTQTASALPLGIDGFSYPDLHRVDRLRELHETFCRRVAAHDPALWAEWDAYRQAPDAPRSAIERSDLLVRMAPHVSRFVAALFGIEHAVEAVETRTRELEALFRFKIDFVRRRALPLVRGGRHVHADPADETIVDELTRPWAHLDREMAVALAGCALMDREIEMAAGGSTDITREALAARVDAMRRWCAAGLHDPHCRSWVIFRFPETLDFANLVHVERRRPELPEAMRAPDGRLRRRDGFTLTDPRGTDREVLSEVHYCVICHERDKDSCSKGLRDRHGTILPNPLGVTLHGCPLDEKISEMHLLRKHGDAIGALALVMLDNPMCPGTGHRVCNDCMKACIYQKQEPVNIPLAETGVLTDVLRLSWGVEIYGLLTRWNPLNVRRPCPLPYNGRNVLVVGLGPAGYTLAHHLLNEGFGVAAIDGLKIEPLDDRLTGTALRPPEPIARWDEIYEPLDERILAGFGGVAEYGITARWDKNFLTLIQLTLARRERLRTYGGIRFGGTLTLDAAWAYGFDHVAIAAGAGSPTVIAARNNLARGVRQASDFLMALQLGGAFKRGALPNLQARLPAIVVGGGLTAFDTATETFAYYPAQVEKVLERYEALAAEQDEAALRGGYDEEELQILDELLAHGRAVRAERQRAAQAGERPDFVPLMRAWGGVTLIYRKRLIDAPAYRLNHEEVAKALEEGMEVVENLDPREMLTDEYGHVRAVVFQGPGREVELPARTVLVAAGTSPNIAIEKERPGTFEVDPRRKAFVGHRAERAAGGVKLVPDPKGFFTSYNRDGRLVSFYGDNHPAYAGNVVRAMASAKHGYVHVAALFADEIAQLDPAAQASRDAAWDRLASTLDADLLARVERVERLTSCAVEVVVRAPAAARAFEPGQFYRVQNFEARAPRAANGRQTPLAMEGVALAGAAVDRKAGLITFVALEEGVSARLLAGLRPGDPVVVMGPTGAPSEIPRGEDVLLVGGGSGNVVLLPIAKALREQGNRVLFVAGYKRGEDLVMREAIEEAADQVVWATDRGVPVAPQRPQDVHVRGDVVRALVAYAEGRLGPPRVPLGRVSRVMAIGSDRMMAAVRDARRGALAPHLRADHVGVAGVNSPMQCMMKEICAQCLQRHVDPATGREEFVYSCAQQDQLMDVVDFSHLGARLRQNTVQEKLAGQWLNHLLDGPT